jgi:hypothetical protein
VKQLIQMEHQTTIEAHLPERYFLGELSAAVRDEFEEHMADCLVCRQELTAIDGFAANALAVFEDAAAQKSAAKESGHGWLEFFRPRSWPVLAFSGAMNIALLGLIALGVSQNIGPLRSNSTPDAGISEVFSVRPPTRSPEVQSVSVNKSQGLVVLQFDLPRHYQRYSWTLDGAAQNAQIPVSASAEALALTVPLASLRAGEHRVELNGWDGQQKVDLGVCILKVGSANK